MQGIQSRSIAWPVWSGLWAVPALGWMWWRLIDALRLVWSVDPRYAYGWSVPLLCAYLAWLRWDRWRAQAQPSKRAGPERGFAACEPPLRLHADATAQARLTRLRPVDVACVILLGLGYAAARWIQEANPWWALAHWALALTVVGLTLWFLRWALPPLPAHGRQEPPCRPPWDQFVFPVAFILVAVPWPYLLTEPVIQALTWWNTLFTVEILGWLGIPAVPHGNVIELASGRVGVDEACSGIRSLQGTLMLSLLFGELYALRVSARVWLVLLGPSVALLGNLARTVWLTLAAARGGESAVAAWHDPAGVTVLLVACAGVWLMARWLCRRSQERRPKRETSGDWSAVPEVAAAGAVSDRVGTRACLEQSGRGRLAGVVVLIWVAAVELGVNRWYTWVESRQAPGPDWTLEWPVAAAGQSELEISRAARELLQFDEAHQVRWQGADGRFLQLSWFRWRPGRAAAYLAKSHSPLVCMPASGFPVEWVSGVRWVEVGPLRMPYRIYRFRTGAGPCHVLYTRWDEGTREQSFAREGVGAWNRLSSVWTGRGTQGQQVLVLAVWGMENDEEAEIRLRDQELKPRLQVIEPGAPGRGPNRP